MLSVHVFAQTKDLPALLKALPEARDTTKLNLLKDIAFMYHLNDMYDSAFYYYNLLAENAKVLGHQISLGDGYNGLGLVYYRRSQYEKSLEQYFKALKIYEDNKGFKQAAGALSNIANIFTEQDKYEEALNNLFRAVELNNQIKDSIILMALYTNIARNYGSMDEFAKAKKYQDSGLFLIKTKMSQSNVSPMDSAKMFTIRLVLLQGRAHVLMDEKNYRDAIVILKGIWKDVQLKRGVKDQTEILEQTASNYFYLKQYDSALYYSDQVLQLLKKDSIPEQYRDIYEVMSESYAGLGDYKNAYTAHRNYKQMADSIINSEKLLMSEEMKTKYESEKKEAQILQLEEEKKSQKIIIGLSILVAGVLFLSLILLMRSKRLKEKLLVENQKLEAATASKKASELELLALRSQINPHFIFNGLNSISNYILKSDTEKANNYLGKFAVLMRKSLEQSRVKNIELADEINLLGDYLELEKLRLGGRMNFELNYDSNLLETDILIPSMIIQPFLENAIKHGLPEDKTIQGIIVVEFKQSGDYLQCSISDNGQGIYRTQQNNHHQSLGNSITQKRIELINSSITDKIKISIEDLSIRGLTGTRVQIDFPLQN